MKRKKVMDNCAYGECSKPKKSKSCQETEGYTPDWAHLPTLVLHKIFDMLDAQDRKNTSSVCRYWRQNSFHPKWWPEKTFKILEQDMDKARFLTSTFGMIVSHSTVILNSLSPVCVEEFVILLRLFNENNNLRSLILEPTHCQLEMPYERIECSKEITYDLSEITNLLTPLLARLEKFSVGCIEDLCHDVEGILSKLDPSKLKLLGLATVKDDPCKYETCQFNPTRIAKFVNLEVLSIDYEQLSDAFLKSLNGLSQLSRLIVHVHALPSGQAGASEGAWCDFAFRHPRCQLRLTLIHAYDAVVELHETVLRRHMPLTHLKVFFCETVNMEALHTLSTYYAGTFRSLMWVDSRGVGAPSRAFIPAPAGGDGGGDPSPDPLVLLAWLCRRLDELIMFGYRYPAENLVALGRLRGPKLRRLDVAEDDVEFNEGVRFGGGSALMDVPKSLQKPWAPLKSRDLHPVIRDPIAGDSDEFILPIVLADLH